MDSNSWFPVRTTGAQPGAEANPSRLTRNSARLAHFTKRSSVIGICFCEFRAKQDDLYRIVHPY